MVKRENNYWNRKVVGQGSVIIRRTTVPLMFFKNSKFLRINCTIAISQIKYVEVFRSKQPPTSWEYSIGAGSKYFFYKLIQSQPRQPKVTVYHSCNRSATVATVATISIISAKFWIFINYLGILSCPSKYVLKGTRT